MTKRHSILLRKLKELESMINYLLSLPPETADDHQLYAPEIEKRFGFVRKLLSAEVSSAHPKKPYHLQTIARRLTELESIFKEWDNIKALTIVEQHFEPAVSTCLSCLNNVDGDGDVSPESYEGLREEGGDEDDDDDDDDDGGGNGNGDGDVENDGKKEEKRSIRVWGKYVGVMGVGVVIGMALMGLVIVKFSCCFSCVESNRFLLAPT